jgi:hypothetical protein
MRTFIVSLAMFVITAWHPFDKHPADMFLNIYIAIFWVSGMAMAVAQDIKELRR